MTTPETTSGATVAIDSLDLSGRLRPADTAQVRLLETVLDQTPPVLVLATGGQLVLLDGYMRVDAARALGRLTVRAELMHGDAATGWERAITANARHGVPLGYRHRRDAALRLLTLAPQWSDRRIASACGVDAKTVGRLRTNRAGRPGEEMPHLTSERVGRDGRRYPSPEELERRRAAARRLLEDEPELSDRAVGRAVLLSSTTVRRLRAQPRSGQQPQQEPRKAVRRRSAARLVHRLSGIVVGTALRTARVIACRVAALFGPLLRTSVIAVRRTRR